ncbi:hypothetical protein [Nocardiopsis sp. BMP B8015]|nr:hypothetical protein [Nocardiopsis sp. BMP B8015]
MPRPGVRTALPGGLDPAPVRAIDLAGRIGVLAHGRWNIEAWHHVTKEYDGVASGPAERGLPRAAFGGLGRHGTRVTPFHPQVTPLARAGCPQRRDGTDRLFR